MEAAAWAQADAAWAQAIMSALAILASTGIAVWVPHRERDAAREREAPARLNIRTTRAMPNGLMVELFYEPEFTNAGIRAPVTVKSEGAQMHNRRARANRSKDASF